MVYVLDKIREIKFTDIKNRFISSIFIGAIFLLSFILGGKFWIFLCLFLSAIMCFEWLEMINSKNKKLSLYYFMACNISAVFITGAGLLINFWIDGIIGLLLLTVPLIINYKNIGKSLTMWIAFGILYVSIPFWFLIHMRIENSWITLLWLFSIIWASDVGAYFSGQIFKGKKIAPQISPNKTWSGFFGGIGLSITVSLLWLVLVNVHQPLQLILFTLILSLVGQIGDLLQSSLKRHWQVKDMGALLPGHGGVFDRFDSFLPCMIILQALILYTGVNFVWH